MRGNDILARNVQALWLDLRIAFALLTRLPLPFPPFDPNRPAARAAWAYPIVGIVVGGISVCAALVATSLGLPAGIAALCAIAAGALTTGAMHEDGLADCADGFWGGWTREKRLEIMKDSQIGTYGVLALLVSFALRWQVLVFLIEGDLIWSIVAAAALSRSAMVCLMATLSHARSTGLSHQTGQPNGTTLSAALAIGLLASALIGPAWIAVLICIGLCTVGVHVIAQRKIGGQTGDVLGATQQLTEITALICVLAFV